MKLLQYVLSKRGELAVAATYICTVSTFIVAYAHPSRSVLVTIGNFNEADLEIVLILLSLPAAYRFLVDSLLCDRGQERAPSAPGAQAPGGHAHPFLSPQVPLPGAGLSMVPWRSYAGGRLTCASGEYPEEIRLALDHQAAHGEANRLFKAHDEAEPWLV